MIITINSVQQTVNCYWYLSSTVSSGLHEGIRFLPRNTLWFHFKLFTSAIVLSSNVCCKVCAAQTPSAVTNIIKEQKLIVRDSRRHFVTKLPTGMGNTLILKYQSNSYCKNQCQFKMYIKINLKNFLQTCTVYSSQSHEYVYELNHMEI